MPQSPRGLWSPRLLRHPPVDAFEQVAQLGRRDRHNAFGRGRPNEAATLQALGEQAHPLAVMPEHFDQPAAAAAEYEQMPTVRVTLERLLHQQSQAIKALAHIGMAGCQPNPRTAWRQDHRRRLLLARAFISADTVDTATVPEIRIRPPVANSTSITPSASGEADAARSSNGGDGDDAAADSGTTATGLNTAGICVSSHSC